MCCFIAMAREKKLKCFGSSLGKDAGRVVRVGGRDGGVQVVVLTCEARGLQNSPHPKPTWSQINSFYERTGMDHPASFLKIQKMRNREGMGA